MQAFTKRILIVDDEESIRFTFSAFLQAAGFEVLLAKDCREGMRRCLEAHCDLAIVDIILPGNSGLTLLEDIRQKHFDFPVILITGKPCHQSLTRAADLGAVDYLIKPVLKQQLISSVHLALHPSPVACCEGKDDYAYAMPSPSSFHEPSPAMKELLLSAKLRP